MKPPKDKISGLTGTNGGLGRDATQKTQKGGGCRFKVGGEPSWLSVREGEVPRPTRRHAGKKEVALSKRAKGRAFIRQRKKGGGVRMGIDLKTENVRGDTTCRVGNLKKKTSGRARGASGGGTSDPVGGGENPGIFWLQGGKRQLAECYKLEGANKEPNVFGKGVKGLLVVEERETEENQVRRLKPRAVIPRHGSDARGLLQRCGSCGQLKNSRGLELFLTGEEY